MEDFGALQTKLENLTRSIEGLTETIDRYYAGFAQAMKASSEAVAEAMQTSSNQLALSMNMATEAHRHATAGSRRYEHRLMWASWALVAATVALLFVTVARIG